MALEQNNNPRMANHEKHRIASATMSLQEHLLLRQEAAMVAGMVLIVAGVLLVIYPPLLSLIVAAIRIAAGAMVISIANYNRKYHRHHENPMIDIFSGTDPTGFRCR
jgi:DMSO reductase anchor subunit